MPVSLLQTCKYKGIRSEDLLYNTVTGDDNSVLCNRSVLSYENLNLLTHKKDEYEVMHM